MDIVAGNEPEASGLTFQAPFPEKVDCPCGSAAWRVFALADDGEFSDMYENKPPDGFWLHDASAFAVYLCRDVKCAKASALWNQA